jgi:hypothetical protein
LTSHWPSAAAGGNKPEQLGFLDKVSKDECTLARRYGWSVKGRHAVKKGVFIWGRRFLAEGLLTLDGMVSNTVVEGSMTRHWFLEYLEHCVVCHTFIIIILSIHLPCPPSYLYAHLFQGI